MQYKHLSWFIHASVLFFLRSVFFFNLDKLHWKGNTWQKDGVIGTNKCLLCFIYLRSIMKVLREFLSISLQQ